MRTTRSSRTSRSSWALLDTPGMNTAPITTMSKMCQPLLKKSAGWVAYAPNRSRISTMKMPRNTWLALVSASPYGSLMAG